MTIDVGSVVATTAQLTVLVAAVGGGVVWLKKWIRQQVVDPLASVQSEVSPNHGNSMLDTVNRTEVKLDALVRRFEDHMVLGHGGRPVEDQT